MTFSLSIGAYALPNFLELNLRSCRRIFGDAPILVYDGASPESRKNKELAERFGANYLTERINRGHFGGCIQSSVCAAAWGKHIGSTISLKINQRLVMLSEDIPALLEEVFAEPKIHLALPPQLKPETIVNEKSRFHQKFPWMVDLIAFRSDTIDATWIASAYAEQVRNGTDRNSTLTEAFWDNAVNTKFKGRTATLPWLSEPRVPPMYLRKCQSRPEDYATAAKALGMGDAEFPVEEWGAMLGTAYRPVRL